jgi:hypothetical protein
VVSERIDFPATCGDDTHGGPDRIMMRDGFAGRAPRRRQRYRCRDAEDRKDFHRFVPEVPRLEAQQHRCLECESPLSTGQGPNAARQYDFVAREVASALSAVASGATYQEAAFTARTSVSEQLRAAEREPTWVPNALRHGQVVADWVEVFTDPVLAGSEDQAWPDVVLLDSTNFWRRLNGVRVNAFHVLLAYGYDIIPVPDTAAETADDQVGHPDDDDDWGSFVDFPDELLPAPRPQLTRGRLLRAEAHRSADAATWEAFLRSWPGTPQVVVADRDSSVRKAVTRAWPAGPGRLLPEFVNCRWHLARRLRDVLVEDLVELDQRSVPMGQKLADARVHPLAAKVQLAFDTAQAYRDFLAEAHQVIDVGRLKATGEDGDRSQTTRWLMRNEHRIIAQIERRKDRVGPESTGPLEAEIFSIRSRLARRAQSLRNQPRTNLMLRLLVAGRRGQANERSWTEKIRQHLAENAGTAPRQRAISERFRQSSL